MRFNLPTMEEIRDAGTSRGTGVPMLLPLENIDEDPEQPRKEFDEESLAQLAATIAARGLRQPVSVRRHPEQPGRWMLNFGARRLRAAKLAGEATIAAFEDAPADSYDQVIENEQREGLKPLELALFVKRQLDRGHSRTDIARGIGKSQSYVTYACSLIDPPDWLMDVYRSGKCRAMFELHELRRLHETDGRVVETWLAEAEQFGRAELKLLKSRLAEVGEGKTAKTESRVSRAAHAGDSTPSDSSAPARSPRPFATNRSTATSEPKAAGILKQLKSEGDRQPLRSVVALRLVVRAWHDGASVRVVQDELPEVPSSVFVINGEGARTVVRIDALARVELALDPSPQS